MLEHISQSYQKQISKGVYLTLAAAVVDSRFAVSKFCCGHCYPVFSKLAETAGEIESFFHNLGHTSSFFIGWNSPSFESQKNFFTPLRKKIHTYFSNVAKNESFNSGPLIENSQTEYLVNQIIVPEAFN